MAQRIKSTSTRAMLGQPPFFIDGRLRNRNIFSPSTRGPHATIGPGRGVQTQTRNSSRAPLKEQRTPLHVFPTKWARQVWQAGCPKSRIPKPPRPTSILRGHMLSRGITLNHPDPKGFHLLPAAICTPPFLICPIPVGKVIQSKIKGRTLGGEATSVLFTRMPEKQTGVWSRAKYLAADLGNCYSVKRELSANTKTRLIQHIPKEHSSPPNSMRILWVPCKSAGYSVPKPVPRSEGMICQP